MQCDKYDGLCNAFHWKVSCSGFYISYCKIWSWVYNWSTIQFRTNRQIRLVINLMNPFYICDIYQIIKCYTTFYSFIRLWLFSSVHDYKSVNWSIIRQIQIFFQIEKYTDTPAYILSFLHESVLSKELAHDYMSIWHSVLYFCYILLG